MFLLSGIASCSPWHSGCRDQNSHQVFWRRIKLKYKTQSCFNGRLCIESLFLYRCRDEFGWLWHSLWRTCVCRAKNRKVSRNFRWVTVDLSFYQLMLPVKWFSAVSHVVMWLQSFPSWFTSPWALAWRFKAWRVWLVLQIAKCFFRMDGPWWGSMTIVTTLKHIQQKLFGRYGTVPHTVRARWASCGTCGL